MTGTVARKATRTDKLFRIALVLKGLDGGVQLIGAIVLAIIPPAVIGGLAHTIVTRDLLGDQNGTLATHLTKAAADFTGGDTRTFAIVFLLLHGIVKLVLVFAMLKKILPAYPIAAVVLAGFVVYEVWRAVHTHSIALPFFAALDVIIIGLVLREYRNLRRERRAQAGEVAA